MKIKVQTDDAEDIERWLDGDDDDDEGGVGSSGDRDDLPDNDISQYSTGDDDPADND